MKKFILARKSGMSQLFTSEGQVVPVTIVEAQPNVVTRLKTRDPGGEGAVQIGFDETKPNRLTKPERGHLKGLPALRTLREFTVEDTSGFKQGDKISVAVFEPGERVRVSGKSIGRGFQGVVKRHGFAGGPASHGHRHVLRAPGAIGGRFPQRTLKGKRMAGRMGGRRVSVHNLEIVRVDKESNALWLRGAVPGKRGTIVEIVSEQP